MFFFYFYKYLFYRIKQLLAATISLTLFNIKVVAEGIFVFLFVT